MGNIETTTKVSRLKSISSTENNFLEAATGGVLLKKLFLKTLTQVFSCAYCEFLKNIYFEKHMRTAASDYSFTLAICFQLSLYNYKENFYGEENVFFSKKFFFQVLGAFFTTAKPLTWASFFSTKN